MGLYEFKASLVHRPSSRLGRATHRTLRRPNKMQISPSLLIRIADCATERIHHTVLSSYENKNTGKASKLLGLFLLFPEVIVSSGERELTIELWTPRALEENPSPDYEEVRILPSKGRAGRCRPPQRKHLQSIREPSGGLRR